MLSYGVNVYIFSNHIHGEFFYKKILQTVRFFAKGKMLVIFILSLRLQA
jgi:hypothetical protein